jgi:hypothetical protein
LAFNGLALNGMFDPDTTGGGHQPLGFDQYMAMYTGFCVISTRVTVDFAANGATVPTLVGISGLPGTTSYSSVTGLVESGSAYKLMPSATSVPITLTAVYDLRKMFGIDDFADEPDYWGNSAGNPFQIAGCRVWARDILGTSTVNLTAFVVMDFDCFFMKPTALVQS